MPWTPALAATANDPLAALIGGELSPLLIGLALLLAAGLGAAHALSPGHGKTLVAAYLVIARDGPPGRGLGLTVAATHTAGVLCWASWCCCGGELFLPEQLIGWLTVISGAVMAALGVALVWRAVRRRSAVDHNHDHEHGQRARPRARHAHGHSDRPVLTVRSVALLGMPGAWSRAPPHSSFCSPP